MSDTGSEHVDGDGGNGGSDREPLSAVQRERLRADLRVRLLVIVPAVLIGAVVIVVLVVHDHARHPQTPVRWPLVIGLVAGMLVLAALGVGLGLWFRARNRTLQDLIANADRATVRRVSRQLRRGQTVAESDLSVAGAIVELSRRQRWIPWYGVVVGAFMALQPVLDRGRTPARPVALTALNLTAAALLLAGAAALVLTRRRVLATARRQGITPDARG